jgi:hypothetical protein
MFSVRISAANSKLTDAVGGHNPPEGEHTDAVGKVNVVLQEPAPIG